LYRRSGFLGFLGFWEARKTRKLRVFNGCSWFDPDQVHQIPASLD
jgi:hypothetical protein